MRTETIIVTSADYEGRTSSLTTTRRDGGTLAKQPRGGLGVHETSGRQTRRFFVYTRPSSSTSPEGRWLDCGFVHLCTHSVPTTDFRGMSIAKSHPAFRTNFGAVLAHWNRSNQSRGKEPVRKMWFPEWFHNELVCFHHDGNSIAIRTVYTGDYGILLRMKAHAEKVGIEPTALVPTTRTPTRSRKHRVLPPEPVVLRELTAQPFRRPKFLVS